MQYDEILEKLKYAIVLHNSGQGEKIILNDPLNPIDPDIIIDTRNKKFAIIAGDTLLAHGKIPDKPEGLAERVSEQISGSIRRKGDVVILYSTK